MSTPMKPCARNKQLLAGLVLDALSPAEHATVQAHLESCPGCRQYRAELSELWAEHQRTAAAVPETPVGESFHRRLRQRLQAAAEKRGAIESFLALWRGATPFQWSLWAGAATIAVLLLAAVWTRPEPSGRPGDQGADRSPAPAPTAPLPPAPTFSNYRAALNTSPDALDELLTRHAQRSAPSGGSGTFYAFRQPAIEP